MLKVFSLQLCKPVLFFYSCVVIFQQTYSMEYEFLKLRSCFIEFNLIPEQLNNCLFYPSDAANAQHSDYHGDLRDNNSKRLSYDNK